VLSFRYADVSTLLQLRSDEREGHNVRGRHGVTEV
jgi:hypothetical protein